MLTRLKVNGFKNLIDVDVRFGPFTCIAGGNGVGKSNLFDAIRFLSALAGSSLIDAARQIRGTDDYDARSLFSHFGDYQAETMSFTAEMIIPTQGIDDVGQTVSPRFTFLKYELELVYRTNFFFPSGGLTVKTENLSAIPLREIDNHLRFPHGSEWQNTAIPVPEDALEKQLIETQEYDAKDRLTGELVKQRSITMPVEPPYDNLDALHQHTLAGTMPRTFVSVAGAPYHRTTLMARREMQSWRFLHLEPSAMRKSDQLATPPGLNEQGAHLAATLYHVAQQRAIQEKNHAEEQRVYSAVAMRLSQLMGGVREVIVRRDEEMGRLSLFIKTTEGTVHPAHSLSDGTLRFLALAIIEQDWENPGLLCLEEPENGIHPKKIPTLLWLLQNIATKTDQPVDEYNPIKQVIITTHSPHVVQQVPEDSLLVATSVQKRLGNDWYRIPRFRGLPDTWRGEPDKQAVSLGELLSYLGPPLRDEYEDDDSPKVLRNRVIDRAKIRETQHNLYPNGEDA